MGSYKPCTHPHPHPPSHIHPRPPTPSQKKVTHTHTQPKKVTLTHTHPHPVKKRLYSQHPCTPSQEKVITTHTAHTQPKKGHTRLNPAVNLWKKFFFFIHQLIKFIRNSRSPKYNFHKVGCQIIDISIQYRTNDKSPAVINNLRHILIKNYIPFICYLSLFHLTSSYNVLSFFQPRLLLCIIIAVTCTTLRTVHNMLDYLIQKKQHIMKEDKDTSHISHFYL